MDFNFEISRSSIEIGVFAQFLAKLLLDIVILSFFIDGGHCDHKRFVVF